MPLEEQLIERRIQSCPRLGSLRRINSTFQDLANADRDLTGQIAEIIRRDPSLTSRLLQMVNSVFYGLKDTVSSVEDAVFYLGTKQIRQMALATPVLEDMQQFTQKVSNIDWTHFWQQSIGCAIMTREILSFSNTATKGDSDYISGLIHGVGYLVSVSAFPDQMKKIIAENPSTEEDIEAKMLDLIGWNQAQIGGYFLECNNIPQEIREAVWYQNTPEKSEFHKAQASSLYVAKRMIAEMQGNGGNMDDGIQPLTIEPQEPSITTLSKNFRFPLPATPSWEFSPELHTLLTSDSGDIQFSTNALKYTLSQLPNMLNGLV